VTFEDCTTEVWIALQNPGVRLRPKSVYGKGWRPKDLKVVFEEAARIGHIREEVI